MLLCVDIWEMKIILIQDNILTLQVWGKKKCVPFSFRQNQHKHLGLKPQLICVPFSQTQSTLWDEKISQLLQHCNHQQPNYLKWASASSFIFD